MKITQTIKTLKNIQPSSKWLQKSKDVFLIQVKRDFIFKKQEENNFVFLKLFLRPAGAFGLMAILLFGSSTFAFETTKNTVPGDPLYVIKINLEKTQKILTNNKEKKVGLAIKSTSERLKELKKLSHSVYSIKNDENIKTATQNLNEGIKEIKTSLNDLKNESNFKITVKTAKTIDVKTVEYEKELIQTKKESSPLIKEEIEKVLNSVEETNAHAFQTIVDEHKIIEKNSVLEEEINNIIEDKIKQTEEKIEETKIKTENLVKISEKQEMIAKEQGGGEIDQIDQQKIKKNDSVGANDKENQNEKIKNQNDNVKIKNTENTETQKQENNENNPKEVGLPNIDLKQENTDIKSEKFTPMDIGAKTQSNETENSNPKEVGLPKVDKENKETIKEIIKEAKKETKKAEEILKEAKESLKQKDLDKIDLNIITDKVIVSKKLVNIANKVADKATEKSNK